MEKTKRIIFLGILCILIILLSIIQFILGIILVSKIKSDFKERPEKHEEKIISGLKSFHFTEETSRPRYSPSEANLGLTGDLYLDCYAGACYKIIKEIKNVSDYDDCKIVELFHNKNDINKDCSEECYELKKNYVMMNALIIMIQKMVIVLEIQMINMIIKKYVLVIILYIFGKEKNIILKIFKQKIILI